MTPTPLLISLYAEMVRAQAATELDAGERTLLEFNSIDLAIASTLRQVRMQVQAMAVQSNLEAKGKNNESLKRAQTSHPR